MKGRALVLGGGGTVGIAWELGLAAGLRNAGVDLAAADLIVGTSAGSVVGCLLASGADPGQVLAAQATAPPPPLDFDLKTFEAIQAKWTSAPESSAAIARELGAMALAARTVPEETWVGTIAGLIGVSEWPERPLLVTGVDAHTGEAVAWDRSAGVPVPLAVAASCTVPGLFPPVSIGGRRYVDGGVRSGTHAHLVRGHARVIVIAPLGARSKGLGALARRYLEAEVALLRREGSSVEVVFPDAAALEAFGDNLMDPARVPGAAMAGFSQAAALAGTLQAFWA